MLIKKNDEARKFSKKAQNLCHTIPLKIIYFG